LLKKNAHSIGGGAVPKSWGWKQERESESFPRGEKPSIRGLQDVAIEEGSRKKEAKKSPGKENGDSGEVQDRSQHTRINRENGDRGRQIFGLWGMVGGAGSEGGQEEEMQLDRVECEQGGKINMRENSFVVLVDRRGATTHGEAPRKPLLLIGCELRTRTWRRWGWGDWETSIPGLGGMGKHGECGGGGCKRGVGGRQPSGCGGKERQLDSTDLTLRGLRTLLGERTGCKREGGHSSLFSPLVAREDADPRPRATKL